MRTLFQTKTFILFLTSLLAALLSLQPAHANLVLNPFFTGTSTTATNWPSSSAGIGAAFNSTTVAVPAAVTAAGGSTEFYSGCVGSSCVTFPLVVGTSSGAQQTINTAIGTSYQLSFYMYSSGTGSGLVTGTTATQVDVYWGSARVYNGFNVTPSGWQQRVIDLGPATASSYTLTAMIRDDPSYSAITYMSVEPVVLSLAKANPPGFAIGAAANYGLTINNVSTLASSASFTLLDQLPPNIQYNSVTAGSGLTSASCVASGTLAAGQLLTCTISTASGIPAGGSAALSINVTPLAGASGVTGINKASIPFNGTGSGVPPSSCTANNVPLGCAVAPAITPGTVNLVKTNPGSFLVGVASSYGLTISNNLATATAASFTLQDRLPPNIQFNSATAGSGLTGASCVASGTLAAGQLLTCTLTSASGIPAGGTASLGISVTPTAASGGFSGTNKASVPANGTGSGVAPSTCTATGAPAGCAVAAPITPSMLSLSKTSPPSLQVGIAANYTLTISNGGGVASSTSFTLLDQLPPNIQYNSSSAGSGLTGASCVASGTVAAGQLLTCTLTSVAGIPAGGSGSLSINVTPLAASAAYAAVNKASIPPAGSGSGVAPSTCTANGTPAGCALSSAVIPSFLSLAKLNPVSFSVGVPASYTLTISNGGGIASGTTFTLLDQLPPNIQFNSSAAGAGLTGAACSASGTVAAGQLLTCTVTSAAGIPASGSGSLTISVTPQAAGSGIASVNKASIPASGSGTGGIASACISNNNPAGCAVAPAITPGASLSLAKTNPGVFSVSVPADYSLVISNAGGSASATSFTLLDQLPPNIQFNSAAPGSGLTGASCVASGTIAAGQLLTCTVTSGSGIPAGGSGTLSINVTPLAASLGVAGINKASVPPAGTGSGVSPSGCTATGTPAGCALAPAITPTSYSVSVSKTATVICDPLNGTSNPKNIPGAITRWTITVSNVGTTSVNLANIADVLGANMTAEPNLVTGAGGVTSCVSATGTPESAAGKGFKLAISGTPVAPATTLRPAASYPKFFTSAADADAASFGAGSIAIDYALGLPAEGAAPNAYTAGELKPGETVVVYFNVTLN